MLRIKNVITISGLTGGAWHDEFHVVKVFKACYALNALYGAGSFKLEFDNAHGGIRQNTLKLLSPILLDIEVKAKKLPVLKRLCNEDPDINLVFTGFHELLIGGYDFDLLGYSYTQVPFDQIIELMLEAAL